MIAIYDLVDEVQQYGGLSSVHYHKMMHPIPETKSVNDRGFFLLEKARDKRILDIGCTGELSAAIAQVASEYYGVDKSDNPEFEMDQYYQSDLDDYHNWDQIVLPYDLKFDYVIVSEVVEHLSNPGYFLNILKPFAHDCPIILTAPNGLSSVGQYYIRRGIEHVNRDHVAWYSWYTLKNLIERHDYKIIEWYWYNGDPGTAEGMIFIVEVGNGAN